MLENYSNPEIVYRNARIVYGPNVQIKPSTHAGKKYMLLNQILAMLLHLINI